MLALSWLTLRGTTTRLLYRRKRIAADVQVITWKLVECAKREERRYKKERRAPKKRQNQLQELADHPADQVWQ